MAVSGTDLTTAEGVKKLIDELSEREEVVLAAWNNDNNATFYVSGSVTDYESFTLSIVPTMTGTAAVVTIAATTERQTIEGYGSVKINQKSGYFNIVPTITSTLCICRVTGKRAGGGQS